MMKLRVRFKDDSDVSPFDFHLDCFLFSIYLFILMFVSCLMLASSETRQAVLHHLRYRLYSYEQSLNVAGETRTVPVGSALWSLFSQLAGGIMAQIGNVAHELCWGYSASYCGRLIRSLGLARRTDSPRNRRRLCRDLWNERKMTALFQNPKQELCWRRLELRMEGFSLRN